MNDHHLFISEFSLPLKVTTSTGEQISDSGIRGVYKYLEKDWMLFERHIKRIGGLQFVNINSISIDNGQNISLGFSVKDTAELEDFYNCTKDKGNNKLSECITRYSDEQSMELQAGFSISRRLVFSIVMPEKVFYKGKHELCDDEDDEENSGHSTTVSSKAQNPQPPGKSGGNPTDTRQTDQKAASPWVKEKDNSRKTAPGGYPNKEDTSKVVDAAATNSPTTNQDEMNVNHQHEEQALVSAIRKTFIVYVPNLKDRVVDYVRIVSESVKELNREMKRHHDDLYEVTVDLPADYDENMTYLYEAKFSYFRFNIFHSNAIIRSLNLKIGKQRVVRDKWEKYELRSMYFHLLDIILHDSHYTPTNMNDLCMQIEDVCSTKLPLEDVKELISYMVKRVMLVPNDRALFAIAIGNIINTLDKMPQLFNQKTAYDILNGLGKYSLDELPKSCSGYMPAVCKQLCEIALREHYCLLTYMDMCYSFYGENRLMQMTQNLLGKQTSIAPDNDHMQSIALELCRTFSRRFIFQSIGEAKTLLDRVLRSLPFKVALHVYKLMEMENAERLSVDESSIQTTIYGCLSTQMQVVMNNAKKTNDLQYLLVNWRLIDRVKTLKEAFKGKFEKELIDILSRLKSKGEKPIKDVLKEFCNLFRFFDSQSIQMELLEIIAESTSPEVHELFLLLSNWEFMKGSYVTLNTSIFKTWFERAITTHSRSKKGEDEIMFIFSSLSDLLCITSVQDRTDLQKALEGMTLTELRKKKLEDVLRKTDVVEKMSEKKKHVGILFKKLVQELIKKKYQGLKPVEVLLSLGGTKEKLRVNSSFTADIVCTILDVLCDLPEKSTEIETFLSLVQNFKLWKLVFEVSGKASHLIKESMMYKKAEDCLREIIQLFKCHDIKYSFVRSLANQAEDAKDLIVLGGCKKVEINKLWRNAEMSFKEEQEKLSCVCNVMSEVKKRMHSDLAPEGFHLPEGYAKLYSQVKAMETKLSRGEIRAKDCMSKQGLWAGMADLPMICKYLESRVSSQVFWNVCTSTVCEEYSKCCKKIAEDDLHLDGLCSLFDEIEIEDDSSGNTQDVLEFLQILLITGGFLYKEAWQKIQEDSSIGMSDVLAMFCKADYAIEIGIAEMYFQAPILENTTTTLLWISKSAEIGDTVNAMKSSLKAFAIDCADDEAFLDAVKSFEKLLNGDSADYTFADIRLSLQTMFNIAEGFSTETICILKSLGNCSSLLFFLRTIVEEDIRNLIDAVEDISEQHVRESTVSGLIEVKRFLHPLLRPEFEKKGKALFLTVERQTQLHGKAALSLPAKIDDCMENLHNLKSLYNNVANRGEQTKDTIESIVYRGRFHFTLDKENSICDFSASYKQAKKPKEFQSRISLVDLRSRALLLMNTERAEAGKHLKSEDLEKFVGYVDLCLEIADIVYNLHTSGHVKYVSFTKGEEPIRLDQVKEELSEIYKNWQGNFQLARRSHFLLNFVQGTQIHTLYNYLEKDLEMGAVEILLKYIHPDMQISDLRDVYLQEKEHQTNWDDVQMLHCMGISLNCSFESLGLHERKVAIKEDQTIRITDVVQVGKLLVAHLEESSLLVVRTILALFSNTTKKLPEANQVLFCTRETTWSELQIFLDRCLGASLFYEIRTLFCIANVEMLPNEVQFKLVESLRHLKQEKNFLLAIVCRGSKNHPFIDELGDHVMTVRPSSVQTVQNIFLEECPNVCTFTSEIAGLGKTNTICQRAHAIQEGVVTLHISGAVNKRIFVERLRDLKITRYHVLHLDIGNVDNHVELDTFLFELIILRHVTAGTVSVSLPTSHISIEIANTINDSLRNSLQTAVSFRREHLKWNDYRDYIVSREVQSPVQVVCHFLKCLEKSDLDKKDLFFSGINSVTPLSANMCRNLLKKYIYTTSDLSFSVINIFLNVLADQLKKMSCSAFFRTSRISEMIGPKTVPTVRTTLAKALVEVSQEFSSRSVNACRSTQASTLKGESYDEAESYMPVGLAASTTKRLEGMIQWEESNHLIYVFHNQNIQTISPMYRDKSKVPEHIRKLFEGQMKKQMQDFKSMDQSQLQTMLQKIARTDPFPLPQEKLQELAGSYALTPDNLLKMVLIMLRITANIPVVVMGETGCGKTSLIRYLAAICEVPFSVMNIHAGVEEHAIVERVLRSNDDALKDLDEARWLFLDEINTCEHLGLISDIICHHRCLGKLLAPNLVVMGACNPYKLRSVTSISTAGLQGKVKTDELSRLVYRVVPLPEMLVDYVWDFGSLSEKDEEIYIERMVEGVFPGEKKHCELLSDLLSMSQKLVRDKEKTSYSVSLRDVQRCKTLTEWFVPILMRKSEVSDSAHVTWDIDVIAMILSLAHCYHSRFSDKVVRKEYRTKMEKVFQKHGKEIFGEKCIHDIINEEQRDFLDRMELPPGTAKNTALQENVFVILVCILNRIPIFVVGKPGCSKSLAMQIIRSNLRGKDSKDEFFKTLPQLYCVSFQGSESSTSDGIIKVFEKAEKYQDTNIEDEVLSVVILDEIGLAEISRFNPLKVLHNLLEPDGQSRPNVAVVGISNWSLDASKMNRAIHLSRPEMDEVELYETGISISDSFVITGNRTIFGMGSLKTFSTYDIEEELRGIANAYFSYIQDLRFKNFHGLRDFYSLVKFIARTLSEADRKLTEYERSVVIMQGIERNFGGLPEEKETLLLNFTMHLTSLTSIQIPVVDLITNNITDPMARHLMLITTGESVLGIVEEKLAEIGRDRKAVIFGSQFEEDLTDDYNYRILSRIILCMEEGLVLILKDLENIYGSLYDMLNQNYTVIGKKKNCRVALGPYSNPICHVADAFRCIVLVDESKINFTDPPFLNRFEKHYLKFADIISEKQGEVIQSLEAWIDGLSSIKGKHFTSSDAFPIYSEDMVSSLILHLDKGIQTHPTQLDMEMFLDKCKAELLWIIRPEVVVRLRESIDPDVQNDSETIRDQYFSLPVHEGMNGLMKYQFEEHANHGEQGLMTVVFTNSNIHTKVLQSAAAKETQVDKLGAFKSEKQLSMRMQHFWLGSEAEVLFLQCSAVDDKKHIMLAKSVIERYRHEYHSKCSIANKHVYLVIHMARSKGTSKVVSQINFLSDWKLVMLDSLECPQTPLPELCSATLYDTIMRKRPLNQYIEEQLFWTFSRIRYTSQGRGVESIRHILEKMKLSPEFLEILDERIWTWIRSSHPNIYDTEWQVKVACDSEVLHTSSSFVDALETHILSVIDVPLSKTVYQMEKMNILNSYFIQDGVLLQRRKTWRAMLDNEQIFSVRDVPDVSRNIPEPYSCESKDLCLRMPFSSLLYEKIETTRDEFLVSLTLLKSKCDLDEDEDLPPEVFSDLLLKQENFVLQKIPDMTEYLYESWADDYVEDFCNIVSHTTCSSLPRSKRIEYMKWIILQKTDLSCKDLSKLFIQLHSTFWAHSSLFNAELQLLETCREVLLDEKDSLMKTLTKTLYLEMEETHDESLERVLENVEATAMENSLIQYNTDGIFQNEISVCAEETFMVSTPLPPFNLEHIHSPTKSEFDVQPIITDCTESLNEQEPFDKDLVDIYVGGEYSICTEEEQTNKHSVEIDTVGVDESLGEAHKEEEIVCSTDDRKFRSFSHEEIEDRSVAIEETDTGFVGLFLERKDKSLDTEEQFCIDSEDEDHMTDKKSDKNSFEVEKQINEAVSEESVSVNEGDPQKRASLFEKEDEESVGIVLESSTNNATHIDMDNFIKRDNITLVTEQPIDESSIEHPMDQSVKEDITDDSRETVYTGPNEDSKLHIQFKMDLLTNASFVSDQKDQSDDKYDMPLEIEHIGVGFECTSLGTDYSVKRIENDEYLNKHSFERSNSDLKLPSAQTYTDGFFTGLEDDNYLYRDTAYTGKQEDSQMTNSLSTSETALFESINVSTVGDAEKNDCPQELLVDIICKKMLPTSATIDLYKGVLMWQRKVNCLLTLAARVSQEPHSIHTLRFCNDVAAGLIIPFSLDVNILQNLGHLLRQHQDLDSNLVFQALMNIIESAPCEAVMVCQQILTSYFIRCLMSNPSTSALNKLLLLVLKSKLPDNSFSLLKSPLQLALHLEMDEDDAIFTKLLCEGGRKHSKQSVELGEELNTTDEEDIADSDSNTSPFLSNLDQCLKQMFLKGNGYDPFFVLVVDLMEEIYSESMDDEALLVENDCEEISLFLCCHSILIEAEVGLQYIAAVAYFKTFIQSYVRAMEDENMKPKPLATVNAVFQDIKDNHVSISLLRFFLKALGMNSMLNRVIKQCDNFQERLPFLKKISWTDTFSEQSFDSCPLNIHVPDQIKGIQSLFDGTQDGDTEKEQLASIANEASNSVQGMVLLYSVAMNHFYIPRSYMTLDDTRHTQANAFFEAVRTHSLKKPNMKLLKCLVGKEDFKVPEFMHGEESEPIDILINTYLSSLYALLLAFNSSSNGDNLPILAKCLLHPSEIRNCYLPGFPDSRLQPSSILDTTASLHGATFTTCQCGHRLAVHGFLKNCIICKQSLLLTELNCLESESIDPETGFIRCTEMNEVYFGVRDLSPVACNILYILTKGCLIGSLALGLASSKLLEEVTGIPEIDVSKTLWKDIEDHWINISRLLNLNDNSVGLLLHTTLRHTRDQLCENRNAMKSVKDRLIWEEEFSCSVSKILKDRFPMMTQINSRHLEIQDLPRNCIEQSIQELDDPGSLSQEERIALLPALFRIRGLPSMENFMYELQVQKDKFPFLMLVLRQCEKLELPIHIFNIVQWHIATASNANYMMKKHECLNMTVTDFIYSSGDEQKRISVRKRFDAFQTSWATLKENKHIGNFERIHGLSKMSDCLILGADSVVYVILKKLVALQNNFLDKALEMAQTCHAVHFLSREPVVSVLSCVDVSEVKKQHLLNFKWDDALLEESQCDLAYGCGRHIFYDFHSIEKGLAVKILVGRSYIEIEHDALPKLIFTDELYKNFVSLVRELKEGVKQENLSSEVITGVKAQKENDPRMATELLTHLGVIMTLLRKTKGDPEKPLVDYAEEWKNLLTRKLPNELLPSPQSSVKLCHVVALHELLEEINSDAIIDALDDKFRDHLDLDMENHLKNVMTDNVKLAELILKAIKRFTHRCLSLSEADPEQPLLSYLLEESFWPDGLVVDEGLQMAGNVLKMAAILPEGLMVRHVYATVIFIEGEMEKQRQDDMTMSKLATNWQSQNKATPSSKAVRKKKTATKFRQY